eukprot:jgi/Chrzof1/1040/Cz01g38050.t1_PGM7[v5.2]
MPTVPSTLILPGVAHEQEVAALRSQVEELKQLVQVQQQAIQASREAMLLQQRSMQGLADSVNQLQLEAYRSSPVSTSTSATGSVWDSSISPFEAQKLAAVPDRRLMGMYDARFHSTRRGATPSDYRVLPDRIFLVRHAESEGNVDCETYTYIPDPQISLTDKGRAQALAAGQKIRHEMEKATGGTGYRLFLYTSPYKRSVQTYEGIRQAFASAQVAGWQEEVQLREQDFGNFQDAEGKKREKAERLRFGRFFYRFPNGESGADVYDRITIFEDHMIRDINAGRFANNTSLVLVTHGLALRIFLMRWFHWSVDQFMNVYNPPNAEPLVLEKVQVDASHGPWLHTKTLYRLSAESQAVLRGCTNDMCSTSCLPPGFTHEACVDLEKAYYQNKLNCKTDASSSESPLERWVEMGGGW